MAFSEFQAMRNLMLVWEEATQEEECTFVGALIIQRDTLLDDINDEGPKGEYTQALKQELEFIKGLIGSLA